MIDSGGTAWVLTSSALVFIMVPGLAFFYAGLVRGKNALGTLMQSFIALAIVGLTWVLWGYSLAFGPDVGGFIGKSEVGRASRGVRRCSRTLRGHDPAPGLHGIPG